jgi:hypothetical protein
MTPSEKVQARISETWIASVGGVGFSPGLMRPPAISAGSGCHDHGMESIDKGANVEALWTHRTVRAATGR